MPTLQHLFVIPAISSLILSALPADAYIPAVPINDTSGLNLTDSSTISISWQNPAGVYSGSVSYQLQADIPTNGTTSGALVHFSESTMGPNMTTDTPWIAFISCDANETTASREWDIFTLARDRGAVSALLYTTASTSCLLNSHYIRDFEKPLDVFATKTVQVARVIDNQFRHTNDTYLMYSGALLNLSGLAVNQSLAGATFNSTTYLVGTLVARNSTGQAIATDIPGPTNTPSANTSTSSTLPMIALYVITGLIATAFFAMLLLGWRRARRHPERYGRSEETGLPPRTTAAGIAQAMLDTFPVIKFNRRRGDDDGNNHSSPAFTHKRIESDNELSMMSSMQSHGQKYDPQRTGPVFAPILNKRQSSVKTLGTEETGSYHSASEGYLEYDPARQGHSRSASRKSASASRPTSSAGLSGVTTTPQQTSNLHGVEEGESSDTCPICLLEFEEGDDLRVLPCERAHMYHQACIDPWLLQIAGSCPLCRKDFSTPADSVKPASPATIAASPPAPPRISSEETNASAPSLSASQPISPPQNGFARYLAFMRGERRERRNRNGGNRRRANTSGTAATDLSGASGRGAADEEEEEEEEIYSIVWGTPARPRTVSSTQNAATSAGG